MMKIHFDQFALLFIAILIVALGCSYENSGALSQLKPTDQQIEDSIPGTWVTDDHAEIGNQIGDGGFREITIWKFRPDGTWVNRVSNNNQGLLTSVAYSALNVKLNGTWWVHNQRLHVECSGSTNAIADIALSQQELTKYGGLVVFPSSDKIVAGESTYLKVN